MHLEDNLALDLLFKRYLRMETSRKSPFADLCGCC